MFRIRRVYDHTVPSNRQAVAQVQELLRVQIPEVTEEDVAKLPQQLQNPLKYRFRSILFVADDSHGNVRGFALLLHVPDLSFCYLDYLAAGQGRTGGGIGDALYTRVREEAYYLKASGLFFECLPDDPSLCPNPEKCKQNAARLRFYERFGARPIAGTRYETPLHPGDDNPPYLVYDDLGRQEPLRPERAQAIVRAILERKYPHLVSPGYTNMVVESFAENPIPRRPARYIADASLAAIPADVPADRRIIMTVNDRHDIHHVRERGYVEAPVRIKTITAELARTGLIEEIPIHHYPERYIAAVHAQDYLTYFRRMCDTLKPGESVYPYVFPIRNASRPPKELAVRAGYYCIDTFTPLNRDAYVAAKRAVDCALTGADRLLQGDRLAYALVRPPGHHAERRAFGGFCYFNSNAVAAHYLSAHGRVAILDIDYHHGNGQQDIFYERADVLTISIHGHPRFAYPYFSGYEEEIGAGAGEGHNLNLPLPETVDGARYRQALERALRRIRRFKPDFLVVALGLDTAKGDPTGTWSLKSQDFQANGRRIGELHLPTLVVQEGGYRVRVLGVNARRFFIGLWCGAYDCEAPPAAPVAKPAAR
jgi:acetoin utilization deacetylase AcuC-like enzyme